MPEKKRENKAEATEKRRIHIHLAMKLSQSLFTAFLGISARFVAAYYEENQYGYNNGGDDGGGGEYYTSGGATYKEYKGDYTGDDAIKYWTEYAVQPKKCITYNNKDVIVFSMYEKYYKHCKDKPIGTYIVDVPTFITAWVNQLDANSEDFSGDDYVSPDTTFVNCYPHETNSGAVVSAKSNILSI